MYQDKLSERLIRVDESNIYQITQSLTTCIQTSVKKSVQQLQEEGEVRVN